MKPFFLITTFLLFNSSLVAATCDSQKIVIQAIYEGTKEVPLLEDWSEASGTWRSIIVSDKKIDSAHFRFVENKMKRITHWRTTIEHGLIEKLPLKKILGDDKTREGILTISFFKNTQLICESLVNIHYADQLDFKAFDQSTKTRKTQ
jgi:hypothetical protein